MMRPLLLGRTVSYHTSYHTSYLHAPHEYHAVRGYHSASSYHIPSLRSAMKAGSSGFHCFDRGRTMMMMMKMFYSTISAEQVGEYWPSALSGKISKPANKREELKITLIFA